MNNNFLISIAMTTYNGEKYLKKQLDSIYAQTYKNIEVIVTDDGSTDGTVKILKQYAQAYGLKYFVNKKNLGVVKNFEKALSLCNGSYIALSDQDDIWKNNKLEILLNKIGNCLLIHSDATIIGEEDELLQLFWKKNSGYNINIENFFFNNVVTGCTILMRKELLESALPFPDSLVYHDWWLGICAAKKERICYTPDCLIRYRIHGEQDTGMQLKKFVLIAVFQHIILRLKGVKTNRMVGSYKHLRQMKSLKVDKRCIGNNEIIINDAIDYLSAYLKNILHFKTFFIGLKYHKFIYPQKNYFYLKNILFDIIG